MTGAVHTGLTAITRPFAGRDRRFQLRLGEQCELERIQGAGIGEITDRLLNGRLYARDVWETIRLGLEGGGMVEVEASALLSRYQDQPLVPYVGLACDILGAALAGIPTTKAPPGKPGAGRQGRRRATSPRSTPPAEPSGSPPGKSGR